MLIAFEGGEGSGKGVQIKLLKELLEKKGFKVMTIVEPGGTPEGDAIRDILLNHNDLNLLGITEAFLFSASRAQQVRTVTRPALNKGYIVLSDRSFYSMFPYLGCGKGLSLDTLRKLTDMAVEDTRPNLVILFDLSPEIGISRKKDQKEVNRLDAESMEFHQRVRKGYLEQARKDPEKWRVIDATESVDDIHRKVASTVLEFLKF